MENEIDLNLEQDNEEITRKDNRIKSLSDKVKLTAEERDNLAKEKEEIAQARIQAEKERDFFKGFNTLSSKYQGANEYQDKIWEKVKSGYELEDATIAILAKEGKLQGAPTPPPEKIVAAGGSAATGIADAVEKPPKTMPRDELRAALMEAESKGERLI